MKIIIFQKSRILEIKKRTPQDSKHVLLRNVSTIYIKRRKIRATEVNVNIYQRLFKLNFIGTKIDKNYIR